MFNHLVKRYNNEISPSSYLIKNGVEHHNIGRLFKKYITKNENYRILSQELSVHDHPFCGFDGDGYWLIAQYAAW